MFHRMTLGLIPLIAVMFIAVRAGDNPGLLQDDFTSAAGGCASCHGTGNIKALSKEAPANHCPSAVGSVTDVNYCLKCHTTAASAPAFGWTVHRSHFATHIVAAGQKATCDLCHQLDAGGNFTLIGAVNSPTLKTTAAMVAKMPTYYLSAATSAFLDHTHGEQSAACASCHETAFPTQAPKKEQCFTCHGTYERLAEQSAFHHDTLYPHFGSGGPTECTACHKAHAKSVLGCNQCHSFTTRVP